MRRLLPALALTGCTIHHATTPGPEAAAPVTEGAIAAGSNCFEAATAFEHAVCDEPGLAAANRAMLGAWQRGLREAGLFGRDALLASQRAWRLGIDAACHLPPPPSPAPAESIPCLQAALTERTRALAAWPVAAVGRAAVSNYVQFHALEGAAPPDPALCAALATGADASLARSGTVDPAAWGAEELAGTHGPPDATDGARRIAVALTDANVYGLYQSRARGLSLDGATVLDALSLSQAVQQASRANQGGRFSAFASQTGDYGALDVFRFRNRLLAIAEDPWGFTTPAAPGEFAHAGVWDIAGTPPQPVCLFDTYERPPGDERFNGAAFGAWRAALAAIRSADTLPLGPAPLRDESQFRADTEFVLLNQPLLAVAEAGGGWVPWLRRRHDAVLDALSAWSERSAENRAKFETVFAGLRPAAADVLHSYQTLEALDASEARQATALTVMEWLYGATISIAPDLGADPAAPASARLYQPRYPILASPR